MHRGRFAPSPTGLLHLGHAYSALTVWDTVRQNSGSLVLRIEDIDIARSRPEFERAVLEDLEWLGLEWEEPVMRQSDRMDSYQGAIRQLARLGICYPCRCTRADIRNALAAPQEQESSAGAMPPYPGTCRARSMSSQTGNDAIRLNMSKAINVLGGKEAVGRLCWDETGPGHAGRKCLDADSLLYSHGDIVIARRDIGTSYHLAVVVDDADQGITNVTRGEDLVGVTAVHRLLQELLGLPVPIWNHHRLLRDRFGKRLAKRHDSESLRSYRATGNSVAEIRRIAGLP